MGGSSHGGAKTFISIFLDWLHAGLSLWLADHFLSFGEF
jgi:hypothetical protein